MVQKAKPKYVGTPNADVYVVWIDGVWSIYNSLSRASSQYVKAVAEGRAAQFLRYEMVEVIGQHSPMRDLP